MNAPLDVTGLLFIVIILIVFIVLWATLAVGKQSDEIAAMLWAAKHEHRD